MFLARLKGESSPVAIKIPTIPDNYTPEQVEEERKANLSRTRKEAIACQLLSGFEYFPQMFGCIDINGELCIATEFIGDKTTGEGLPPIRRHLQTRPSASCSRMEHGGHC